MKHWILIATLAGAGLTAGADSGSAELKKNSAEKLPDEIRAAQIHEELRWGLFICWSFSSFSGMEWTRGVHDPAYFNVSGCDTDQWCQVAKDAAMTHILFLTKHHDGFCLWDTDTTELKVTNSPLGIDVLAQLRKSCDKYGLKLALYYSEGDWSTIPNAPRGDDGQHIPPGDPRLSDKEMWRSSSYSEMQKAQLKELCTKYGPIEYWWIDSAQGDGGLSHQEKVDYIHQFQPDSFVGFNHGQAAGRITAGECQRPRKLPLTMKHGDEEHTYLAAEFTYPILPTHVGGANWFYSLPKHDGLCHPPEKLYLDYLGAVELNNIYDVNIGPDPSGRLREIDVKTLAQVGEWIRNGHQLPEPLPVKSVKASHEFGWAPAKGAVDNDQSTFWRAEGNDNWLEVDLGSAQRVGRFVVDMGGAHKTRVRNAFIQAKVDGEWKVVAELGEMSNYEVHVLETPVEARLFSLHLKTHTPSLKNVVEFKLFEH